MHRRRIASATAAFALVLTGAASADDQPTPKPGATSTKSSLPSSPLVGGKPDLIVSFEGSGPGLPTGFTVKNIGNGNSKAAVLRVTANLAPPSPPLGGGPGGCPSYMTPEECAFVKALLDGFLSTGNPSGPSIEAIKNACGNPFKEFLEAVPVLLPGQSKTYMRDNGPHQVTLTGMISQAVSTGGTHVKACPPTLVCAWDVTAVVDAANDNDETNKANNTATKRSVREVSFK